MDLDETWQVGLRPEKSKPCTFPAKLLYGFRREREKMGRRGIVFLWHEPCTTSVTFLRSISAKLSTNTCPENSLFRVQKGTLFVPSLRVMGNVLRCLDCFHPLVDIPQTYPSNVTFAEGCTVFQLSTSERFPLPQYQQRKTWMPIFLSNILARRYNIEILT